MTTFNISDFGAVRDGLANDGAAIQRAIDACAKAGGGRVLIPAGKPCLCGSIELRAHVELHVERGATLLAATAESDYHLYAMTTGPEAGKRVWIYAKNADNIAITGGGTLDGQCRAFALKEGPHIFSDTHRWRPAMTCFEACRHVRVTDAVFRNAANWALHFTGCDDIVVRGITILNDLKFPNCDGIDPDHCRNVRISDCYIEAGDDCIVLKNTIAFRDYGPCENIVVSNCVLVSTSAAIKIGTESTSDFRDIAFTNCVIRGSNRGLAIQLRDDGNVERVLFSNCLVETRRFYEGWWGAGEPIYVTALPRTPTTRVGAIRDVVFTNIQCRSENGAFIFGHAPDRIRDLLLDNVRVEIAELSSWPGGIYDPRPCPPEVRPRNSEPIGQLTPWGTKVRRPTAGYYIENASRVTLRNCSVRWPQAPKDGYTHALEAHVTPELALEGFSGPSAFPDRFPPIFRD